MLGRRSWGLGARAAPRTSGSRLRFPSLEVCVNEGRNGIEERSADCLRHRKSTCEARTLRISAPRARVPAAALEVGWRPAAAPSQP